MSVYTDHDERAIRTLHLVDDWTASGLLTPAQRERMVPELQVSLRRTNIYLRATLFVLGMLIVNAVAGLLLLLIDTSDERGIAVLCLMMAVGSLFGAVTLARRHRLYRFGIEEALAVVGTVFLGIATVLLVEPAGDELSVAAVLIAVALAALTVFLLLGYEYMAIAALAAAAAVPFPLTDVDWLRRVVAIVFLAAAALFARRVRRLHGSEFPGATYGLIEAAAWVALYLVTNLHLSAWLSHPDESGPFYWATYAATWLVPAAGLWLSIRERHRALLDASAVMALATLMTNKAYLGAERRPWDPILFGLLLITVAIVLRRWLAAGGGGARRGFVAHRLLASEKERLAAAGTASVLQPTGHQAHVPGPETGGGRSGGAGASGSF
jgi:hypothetical protein